MGSFLIRANTKALWASTPTNGATVSEDATTSTFTVRLGEAPSASVTVAVSVSDTSEASVSPTSLTFTTTNFATTQTVTVTGVNDNVYDGTISYNVVLNPASPGMSGDSTYDGLANTNVAMKTADNDVPTVTLALSATTIAENGGSATVTATLSAAATLETTVTVAAAPPPAATTSLADFSLSANKTLTIAVGATSSTGIVTITANDDSDITGDERVRVSATASDSITEGGVRNPGTLELRIREDDLIVSIDSPTVTEVDTTSSPNTATLTYTVSVSQAWADGVVMVRIADAGTGTATSGTDYTAVMPATLSIATLGRGNTQTTFDVTVTGDDLEEPDETIVLTLSDATHATISSTAGSGTGTITDNEPTPTLSISSPRLLENASPPTLSFALSLNQASGRDVTVSYADAGTGTATSGTDYTAITTGTLTFAAGETSATLDVSLTDDLLSEGHETIIVRFSNLSSHAAFAGGGTTFDATGTIVDNEVAPTISIVPGEATERFGLNESQFTLELGADSSVAVSVADRGRGTSVSLPSPLPRLPDLNLSLVPDAVASEDEAENGIYRFRIGVVVSEVDSAPPRPRRVEALLPSLELFASANEITSSEAPAGTMRRMGARTSDGFELAAETPAGGDYAVDAERIAIPLGSAISRLAAGNALWEPLLASLLASNSIFSYTVIIAPEGSPGGVAVGVGNEANGVFAASYPSQTAAQSNALFQLVDAGFTHSGYVIRGQFSTGDGSAGGGGGGGGSGDGESADSSVSQDARVLSNALDDIEIDPAADVPAATVEAIEEALASSADLAAKTGDYLDAERVDARTAVETFGILTRTLETAVTAIRAGAEVDLANFDEILSGLGAACSRLDSGASVYLSQLREQTEDLVAATDALIGHAQAAQVTAVIGGLNGMLQCSADAGGLVDGGLFESLQALSRKALTAVGAAEAAEAPGVLVRVPARGGVNETQAQATLEAAGLDAEAAAMLAGQLARFADPQGAEVRSSNGLSGHTMTASDVLETTLTALLATFAGLDYDARTGVLDIALEGGQHIPVFVTQVVAVPADTTEGLRVLADGSILAVSGGMGVIVAGATPDPIGFAEGLAAMDLSLAIGANGRIEIRGFEDGAIFSSSFGYNVLSGGSGRARLMAPPSGSDPASLATVWRLSYPDGTVQNAQPFFAAADDILASLAGFGLSAAFNRDNGILTVNGLHFRAGYWLTPLTAADRAYLEANGDAAGVAYRAVDANGDGRTDYQIITATGAQTAYRTL